MDLQRATPYPGRMTPAPAARARASQPSATRRRPWWLLPIFGSVPEVDDRSIRLLGLIAIAAFFENYDLSNLMSALSYIAADFGLADATLAGYVGIIRLGAIPAFLLIPLADRVGRRRLFIAAVAGMALTTVASAFARTVEQFVVLQMLFRTTVLLSSTLAFVILAEEFPAQHRGWGIGMLGALGATGWGFGALLFGLVERLPYGWRALYAIGVFPIFFVPLLRREIPETARFARHAAARAERAPVGAIAAWLEPIGELVRRYPMRVVAVTLAGGLYSAGEVSVFQFCGFFTITTHGWQPWQFSVMVLLAGAFGMLGNVVAGRLADAFGRRPVGAAVALSFPAFAWLFYHVPGTWLPPLWAFLTLCSVSTNVMVRALGTEVFPTSHRGTAGGWLSLVQTLGSAAGLGATSVAISRGFTLPLAVSAVAILCAIGGASLLLLPETSRLELEAIADDPA
ncbi:MAG TPA: MFS transporter [Candidatus Binatia bacterium]|nr:MFS transporter [Candidatus Binatia bacterium]